MTSSNPLTKKKTLPLFPTSIVGSMPRPDFVQDLFLLENRDGRNELDKRDNLDVAVRYIIALQEASGIDIISDGELQFDAATDSNVAKVSVIGVGMKSQSGVAQKMFQTLADNKINILAISTSEIKISVLIEEIHTELAIKSLHKAYNLREKNK